MAQYLIWSIEHTGWWRPGRSGYTQQLTQAGRYETAEAMEILEDANIVKVNECLVPVRCARVVDARGELVAAVFACYLSNTAHSVQGIELHPTLRLALEAAAEFYEVDSAGLDDDELYDAIKEAAGTEAWFVQEVSADALSVSPGQSETNRRPIGDSGS